MLFLRDKSFYKYLHFLNWKYLQKITYIHNITILFFIILGKKVEIYEKRYYSLLLDITKMPLSVVIT